jgi:SRSO17 transposase
VHVENAIAAVYATAHGHALVDRDLYVQREWFTDPERMRRAGFDDGHAFATKGQIARDQARRVLDAGLEPAWATGDEVYGRSSELREVFEARGIGYVFAVGCDFQLTTSGQVKMRADQALGLVEARGWNRRSISTGELAYYLAYVPEYYVCSLTDLVKVAGARWAIEDDFQDAKQAVGLDETQVRGYRAWKRHTAIALAAYALLVVASALAKIAHPAPVLPDDPGQVPPDDCGMTALTIPEIQRLITATAQRRPPTPNIDFHLAWSDWRRRHQARARRHHDRARLDPAVTRPARGSARTKSDAVRTGPVARASVSAHAQKPALRPPLPRRTPGHLAVRGRVPSPARP